MQDPESYCGREQALFKHNLLKAYLMKMFMIIGQFHNDIRYVDCFSGPWQEESDDLHDTSIGISLDIMRQCRDAFKKSGKDVMFHALYIEKDKKAFQKLQSFLASIPLGEVTTKALPGDFFELRGPILKWCGLYDFTFFFIDPKGWKKVIEIPTLTPLLQRPNSEFLINFMYDFVLRTHTQESFQKDMQAIFGDVPDTNGMTPNEKEVTLLNLYKRYLKEISPTSGGKPRAVSVPVLYPLRDRTLYYLVYLTRHAKGITVFMDASEKLELVQRRVRAQAKQNKRESRSGQRELFPASASVSNVSQTDPEVVKQYWLDKLSATPRHFGIEELAGMLEETGWFESDLQAAFKELQREGKVKNIDDKSKRRYKKFVHFDSKNRGERLIKVEYEH